MAPFKDQAGRTRRNRTFQNFERFDSDRCSLAGVSRMKMRHAVIIQVKQNFDFVEFRDFRHFFSARSFQVHRWIDILRLRLGVSIMETLTPDATLLFSNQWPKLRRNPPHSSTPASFTGAITSIKLRKLPDACVDLIYIDPPFNSNRNYEVFLGRDERETRVRRSTCINADIHRIHATTLCRAASRAKENGQLLLPLRVARLALCENHARSDFGEAHPPTCS